jgi:hypothetical protein
MYLHKPKVLQLIQSDETLLLQQYPSWQFLLLQSDAFSQLFPALFNSSPLSSPDVSPIALQSDLEEDPSSETVPLGHE